MVYLLNDLTSGECTVFYTKEGFDHYVALEVIAEGTLEDYCYFILPDDFCIPVKHLQNAMLIMDALASMGYDSLSLRGEPE